MPSTAAPAADGPIPGAQTTVGLLLCDHVRPGFRWVAGDYPDFFQRLFPDGIRLITYDLTTGEFPADLDRCQAWIISGSRHSVYEPIEWVGRLAGLVRRLDRERRRVVGVCFGAQMIGHALGGRVARAPQGWQVGSRLVTITGPEPWMVPPARALRILHSNADQIVEPPERMRVIGSSPEVAVSVAAVGDHFLGLQGHPEFVPAYSAVLMEARRGNPIPDEVVEAGLASLADPPDTELLASWLGRFLKHGIKTGAEKLTMTDSTFDTETT